jgi:Na+/melibiose symporter-like transporter
MNLRVKKRVLKELTIKARFLSYIGLFSIVIFSILLMKLYSKGDSFGILLVFALLMEIFSFWFFIYTRRIIEILRNNPKETDIVKWANFLSYYYYPKFIFRKKGNPYYVPDDED